MCSTAISADGAKLYVAGQGGLALFEVPSLELLALSPYSGRARSPGYADVALGAFGVFCLDLDGTIFEHDGETLDILAKRTYQPTVMEMSQRIVGGQLRRSSEAITGLEGGFGGAKRIAVGGDRVYVGGRDGVVTCCRGNLDVSSRSRLTDSTQALGIRVVYLAPSTRLYCGVQSTLHVLSTPHLHSLAKLRGGPGVPVFGNVCSAVESQDGRLAFSGDQRGPSIHIWDTACWHWLSRVELPDGGGPACYLAVLPGDTLLCAATECGRFMAFNMERMPPVCVEDGSGGGPLSSSPAWPWSLAVLSDGRIAVRHLRQPHQLLL